MKVVIAPDSFKRSLRCTEVCQIIRSAFLEVFPEGEILTQPLGDGGEGTMDVMEQVPGARRCQTTVQDPLGRPVEASYVCLPGDSAYVEMAAASGLELLRPSEYNPLVTSTFGTGELILHALGQGVRSLTLGIGGSATVDGGAGMMQALGVRLLDADGHELPHGGGALQRLARIDASGMDPRLVRIQIRVACDVTNPLLGPHGAAAVFGPQKGATPTMVAQLEQALTHWSTAVCNAGFAKSCDEPGDGAAGGMGFALRTLLKGKSGSGARLLCDLVELPRQLQGANLVITGEGCSDSQTLQGKLPSIVADLAHEANVPCILLSGAFSGDIEPLRRHFTACFASLQEVGSVEAAMANARPNLHAAALAIASLYHCACSTTKGKEVPHGENRRS